MRRLVLGWMAVAMAAATPAAEWTLALQAWTLNKKTFAETVAETAQLGLTAVEAFPGQAIGGGCVGKMVYTMSEAARAAVRDLLASRNVRWLNYGVVSVRGEAEWRKLFEFAKATGVETLVSEPSESDLDVISRLCDEFDIRLAIHNHPEPSHYWNPETVLRAVANRSRRMSACADTGHWLRSNLDPIECLRKLEGRIVSLHLKDLPEKGVRGVKDVPWGTGVANVDGILKELRRQGFRGVISIEYENWSPTQIEEIRRCIQWFSAWGAEPAAALPRRHQRAMGFHHASSRRRRPATWSGSSEARSRFSSGSTDRSTISLFTPSLTPIAGRPPERATSRFHRPATIPRLNRPAVSPRSKMSCVWLNTASRAFRADRPSS